MRLYQVKTIGGSVLPSGDLQAQTLAFDDATGTWTAFGKYASSSPLPDVGRFTVAAAAGVSMTYATGSPYAAGMLDDDVCVVTSHGVEIVATRIHPA